MKLRTVLVTLLLVLPFLAAGWARADDGEFTVSSAWVNVRGAVFEVNARIDYPLDRRMQESLDAGAIVHFALDCVIEKQNRYWLNSALVDVSLHRELSWNALTQLYELKARDGGEVKSFATVQEALAAAGEVVDWPVVVEPQLDPDATYQIRVRAGYRRGSPARLRALLPWIDGWNSRTEWHAWVLPR